MSLYWFLWRKPILKALFVSAVAVFLLTLILRGLEWQNHWQRIENRGYLIAAVRQSEGVHWGVDQEFTGFEHDIIRELERELALPVRVYPVRELDDLYQALQRRAVDIALPGTSFQEVPSSASVAYARSHIGLVRERTATRDEDERRLGILDPVAHQDVLAAMIQSEDKIVVDYESGRSSAELLTMVEMGVLDEALVDERDFTLQQSVFPNLRFSPLADTERPVPILLQTSGDDSLAHRLNDALNGFVATGLMSQIYDRYFSPSLEFDYADQLTFERNLAARLPQFEALFRRYGDDLGLDWRLLAAIAYQESHLRANARSPTGVRGLMMVTLRTAAEMGISNRLDPEQSVKAGAEYLKQLQKRISADITEPDRTWFALAAYNVGMGHLEDARKITELLGDNPNRWIDVREHLPKLALKDYYPWTRHGYARGNEPVVYVANIRRFYSELRRIYPDTTIAMNTAAPPEQEAAGSIFSLFSN